MKRIYDIISDGHSWNKFRLKQLKRHQDGSGNDMNMSNTAMTGSSEQLVSCLKAFTSCFLVFDNSFKKLLHRMAIDHIYYY